ncbi:SusC/RagA family TonB-linked outer membrane protein [Ohtaekwangia koreensis]|uniref:TonB-linked outer membrane protein, SusC/RagA family n=1 Tax=Ohtaekwangia koreensis TaxID=688867 RepID=A0A1T5MD28_9BACT|nr:SusC/RagA family TonB-linked outer membrane protein [Ohtaekwangia koreensis]SKC86065.1 TonB-linked outer membrane protein, SusC/RagA family [Ohtaekwangia koreensis]
MKEFFTKKMFRLAFWVLTLIAAKDGYAQQTVNGSVLSETNEGMPGVNIVLKGTTNGTTTDVDGKFVITVPGPESVLVISFVGYGTEEFTVGNQSQIDVRLTPDIASLQEVVVIGYGTQRKQDVTTAVTQVKPNEFVPGAVRNAGELLRGKVAGLTLSTSSGDPDAGVEILLRGITSIYGSSAPLVLIDGYTGDMNSISPNDIESIDVLKDASASAIYGTRGKNGVILITTKKAKAGLQPVVEYSGYVATESFNRKANFMDAGDVRARITEGVIDPSYDLGATTDWLDEITRKPINHFHNISLRGGTSLTQYAANVSYQKADGMFIGSNNEEFKLRMDLTHYIIEDKLKVNFNVLKGLQKYGSFNGWTYRQALIRNPTDAVKDENGDWVEHGDQFQYENPLSLIKEQVYDDKSQWTWLTGSMSYFPVDNLELKIVGSQHQWSNETGTYQTKKHISNVRDGRNGVAYVGNGATTENFLDLTADYTKSFGLHRISGLLGYSYIDYTNSGSSITNFNFPTDNFSYHSIEQGRALKEGLSGAGVDSYKSDWKLIGFFGRVGYGFNDKYNVLASVRYEGSSRFGNDNKWGLFPSVSAGWTISKEGFLSDVAAINMLKLRVGYGRTGSISTDPYQSLTRYAYSASQFYFNGTDWVSILQPVANTNPDLGWETNIEYNIGLDFSVVDSRVSGTIDYYDRKLEDLVFDYPVPVPPNLISTTRANAATMTNKGVEISLNIIAVKNDKFEWTTNFNYSLNKNKLKSLSNEKFKVENDFFYAGYTGDPIQMTTHKIEVGKAIGSFYGYKSVGLEEDPDNAGEGTWLIQGANGEVKPIADATEDDRQILGNGLPQWYLAWNNYMKYGNFDMSITMRGAFDYQVLNFQRMFYENPTIVYNRLRTSYDKIDGLTLASPQSYVSYYIEDGDFWKIDNVTIGYNFNRDKTKTFKNARVYIAGSNLATITGYKGIDPEVTRTGLAPGNDDRDKYPTTRTFTLGVNLTF